MLELTPERFAALARSAPWRWDHLTFTVWWPGRAPAVRAWTSRRGALRVETPDGRPLLVSPGPRPPRSDGMAPAPGRFPRRPPARYRDGGGTSPTWGGGSDRGDPVSHHPPELDEDGLVRRRPPLGRGDLDAPMYQDYRWVAMLDPVELADGTDPDTGGWAPATAVRGLAVVEHHGRTAWEAVLTPTGDYDPRCSCCPLLFSPESERIEAEAGAPPPDRGPGFRHAEAHRVRLDVATGVCVFTEEIGGSDPGPRHDLRIEEVDVPPRTTSRRPR
ncbi:hypothetical protein [Actinoalloteichus caeruleus]|uniref:hypothetical protein n=1 Tax=Actinoalloteichus cyanogriseus TaxID=2893586 RepID=UPI003BB8FF60